jgi:hypothetical protein
MFLSEFENEEQVKSGESDASPILELSGDRFSSTEIPVLKKVSYAKFN